MQSTHQMGKNLVFVVVRVKVVIVQVMWVVVLVIEVAQVRVVVLVIEVVHVGIVVTMVLVLAMKMDTITTRVGLVVSVIHHPRRPVVKSFVEQYDVGLVTNGRFVEIMIPLTFLVRF